MPKMAIAVIGAGTCDRDTADMAYRVGQGIAERGAILVTGGLTGVMHAASFGARDAGGLVVGILPGLDASAANEAVDIAIPTGMGQLRNGLVASSARAVIAVAGAWGTLSEIGFAVKLGKPVIAWNSWYLARGGREENTIVRVSSPDEAVERAFSLAAHAGDSA
ncbi:MAG: TIGR00725 family protein [Chloroflexota bacterium]